MRIGLSALSFSYRCGFVGRGTSRMVSQPMDVEGLLTLASRAGLQGVAIPFALLPDLSSQRLVALRTRLATHSLTPVLDSGVVDVPTLEAHIPAAAALGARVVRVLLSEVYEGNRHMVPGGWEAQLSEMIDRLRALRPLAEHHNICLAVENHQDATSDDLIRVCEEVGGQHIGITFDTVNGLMVAEEPLTALRAVAPYLRNVHLSDYLVYPSDEGYRLVRCALGEGGVEFRPLFETIARIAPQVLCHIELVSHSARHIRLLTDAWWQGYGPRDIRAVLPALRIMAQNLRTADDDWRTPWERGADEATIVFYEDHQYAASLSYLRSIGVLERS
ncbi:MAG: sugar phosphate isomerase/epimerase [Chloroflexaceae bacterium]|jgi:sugar phosphate isomerase/epimerase|nr:sugar phosphate isomerase/epimerase [Chloroflexaceae bacterium]